MPKKSGDVTYMLAHHLMLSCIKYTDDPATVESLLQIGPVMARKATPERWQALHSAYKHRRTGTVKVLRLHGAEVDSKALNSKVTQLEMTRKYAPKSGIEQMIGTLGRCESEEAIEKHPESRLAWVKLRQDEMKSKPGGQTRTYILSRVP
jgi:hypothetical protein